jgi:hypothetical protein
MLDQAIWLTCCALLAALAMFCSCCTTAGLFASFHAGLLCSMPKRSLTSHDVWQVPASFSTGTKALVLTSADRVHAP